MRQKECSPWVLGEVLRSFSSQAAWHDTERCTCFPPGKADGHVGLQVAQGALAPVDASDSLCHTLWFLHVLIICGKGSSHHLLSQLNQRYVPSYNLANSGGLSRIEYCCKLLSTLSMTYPKPRSNVQARSPELCSSSRRTEGPDTSPVMC